jgi:dihydroflavonol-4-reductase
MKVAVLGATGMIGQHTARALVARGHSLVVLHRRSSKLDSLRDLDFSARVVDLESTRGLTEALRGLDALIHSAAYYPTKPAPWKDEVQVAAAQMSSVLDAAEAAKVGRVVYVGAAIALPRPADGSPGTDDLVAEERPANRAPYVQVKWEMDRIARTRAAAGVPVSIAIPPMTFGELDRGPTTGRLIVDIANRALPAYIRGNRNVIYAGDAGRGVALVLEKGRVGQRYLLTGSNTNMDDLVKLIAKVAGVAAPSRVVPLGMAKLVSWLQESRYRLFGGALPKVSSTAIAVMAAGQHLDGSKAKRELGYAPEVSLESAIERALRWFSDQGYVRRAEAA